MPSFSTNRIMLTKSYSNQTFFYLRSSLVYWRNELVILLVFFCRRLLSGNWNTYCMVTLLGDATVFVTSTFYQYFISLLILYIYFTLHSQPVCLLIARYQRAVLYVLYCVLVSVTFSVSFTFVFFCVSWVWFSVTLWLFYSSNLKLLFFFCI